ncbi:MAG: ATP-binding cassette domain-containing protein [Chloroflexi bacterium]|nr:ATP-binding cassette domain-containing protein [Chloroflexota bacterium]
MNIELRHIHKRFGPVHANNDISIMLNEGRIIGVLGENGAGKSTLMKILSGYQPADSGEIVIDGQTASFTGPRGALTQGIGMLQQDPLDVGAFTVLENFTFRLDSLFLPNRRVAKQQLRAANARFGFALDPEALISSLSIAQRQQLEIVRLLSLGVKVLILDEPTTGISAEQKVALFDALRHLAREDNLIVLLVSHKLEDVIELCDEVFVLRAGQMVGRRAMPTTPADLVTMMFGQALEVKQPEAVSLGSPVLQLAGAAMHDSRLSIADINLEILAGEVIGLAGLEGSGQEMFMRACAGLHPLDAGSIQVDQRALSRHNYRAFMDAGVFFGAAGRVEEGLIAGLTLAEHMALVMDRRPVVDWPRARSKMDTQITQYNIRGRSSDFIEQLSGGNQQRVLMALLPEAPALLVLEQPTRGLDVESAQWVWTQILARRRTGTAVVFSSSDLEEIVAYSDRIIVFYAGRLHEISDTSQLTIDALGHFIGGEFSAT